MNIRFNGKRILVAGAGRELVLQGIGRDLVKAFAKGGTTVVALSRTQEHLDSLKAECPLVQTIYADVGSCNCHISFADTWFGQ
ncbi:unnamed protein product [Allacma fusca]|uniref:Short-chain dehydrogenase n=1 Tax=Allacma fusca TaxID=39272 RepID=A0A8J2J248_9HEXA|nr:unnamed protein product [Allacma fusca]